MTSPCELLYAASAIWAGLSSWRTLAVLAATVLLAFAASATATTRTYTAQHSGSYSLKSESSDGLGDFSKLNQTFTWTERVYTEVTSSGRMTSTRTLKAQGTLTAARPAAARAAKLPSCTHYHGRLLRFCRALRADDALLVLAARPTAAVAKALQTTVGRATGAQAAGDRSAMALQAATAKRLSAQFRRALHDQATIGRRIATRLRAANLRLRLTTEQSATAIQILLARLAPDAITATELAPVAASALRPSPVDLFERLAHP